MNFFLINVFLMSAPSKGGQPSILDFLTPFIVVFFIMWLLVIRPQRKEQKQRELMLKNLKKGDEVITNGGIIGKVVKIKDDKVEIKVDDNTKITFLKSAIFTVNKKEKK